MTTQVPAATSPSLFPSDDRRAEWATAPLTVRRRLDRAATLVAIRAVVVTEDGGCPVDRLVFEFADALPGYDVSCCPVVYPPFEGSALALRGSEYVEVTLFPATATDDGGWSTLVTASYGQGVSALAQYRVSGDYEGYLHVALGLAKGTQVQAAENADPARLVLDFRVACQPT